MEIKNLYTYKFTVTRTVDGDTVYGIADLGFGVSKAIKVRLYGINAPELRGAERSEGLKSKEWLEKNLAFSSQIYIETIKDKTGKYGRWLGILWVQGTNLNDLIVEAGHAERKHY